MSPLRAIIFDVDFTLCEPGPQLGPIGYVAAGAQQGLVLDFNQYESARASAVGRVRFSSDLDHDQEVWQTFTEEVIRGMGGVGIGVTAAAKEIVLGWDNHSNFELYEDVLPTLFAAREDGFLLALISNTSRDIDGFMGYHGINVDAALTSFVHGKMKPHPSIFNSVLELLGVRAEESVMVGDSIEDDISGAKALGMCTVLIDRSGDHPGHTPAIQNLNELLPLLHAFSS